MALVNGRTNGTSHASGSDHFYVSALHGCHVSLPEVKVPSYTPISKQEAPRLAKELSLELQGHSDILIPGDPGYEASLKRWGEQSEQPAGMVLKASSSDDIAAALALAKKHNLEVAVLGGGHQTNGTSSTTGGLLIDLSPLKDVSVDPDNLTCTAGGGCRWENIDQTLAKYNLCAVGGRIDNTGIGGLSLGGGYGFLSGRYGMVVDNILEVKMVLADGSFVTVSDKFYQDLFWGVRGAGACFGIAVEFTYRCYRHDYPIWAGNLAFEFEKLPAVLIFAHQWEAGKDPAAEWTFVLVSKPVNKLSCSIFYDGPWKEAKHAFGPLLDLGPIMNDCHERLYMEANTIVNSKVPWDVRRVTQGVGFKFPLRLEFVESLIPKLNELQDAMRGDPVPHMINLEMNGSAQLSKVPHNATAFAKRGTHHGVMIMPQWLNPKYDEIGSAWAWDIGVMFQEEYARALGKDLSTLEDDEHVYYGNYDGHIVPAEKVYGSNLPRLQALKAQYDPRNIFGKGYNLLPPV